MALTLAEMGRVAELNELLLSLLDRNQITEEGAMQLHALINREY